MPIRASESQTLRGFVAGTAAYIVGVAIVVAAGMTENHPTHELWTRSSGVGYLLVHHATHIPVWQFRPQWALVPFTLCITAILVATGFVVAITAGTDEHDSASRIGQTVVLGYFPATLAATVLLVATNGAVTAIRMVAPTVLVGIVVPALGGSLGGFLAARYR